ncbi:hypothetical protein GQ42DRAFT_180078 [Ramicandelaber brevisporus]|nr:hypothetical protein GQ42DRAFT_180078 [Ramicandelaber brevisporus]
MRLTTTITALVTTVLLLVNLCLANIIVVTAHNGGKLVDAAKGDTIMVKLKASTEDGLSWVYSLPSSTNDAALKLTNSTDDSNGDVTASFEAVGAGSASITSNKSCKPTSGHVCPKIIIKWTVDVKVV